MKDNIYFSRILPGVAVILLFAACATQKSRHDQSKLGKAYHDVTAKYNGYFNANELLTASILTLETQHTDNYNNVLELYKYRFAPNPEVVSKDLDEAIKKVSVVATLHPNSQWVDDCYLLIGKSYYLKQDFESAQNAFEFFVDEFHPDGTRINKKAKRVNPNASKTRAKTQAAKSNAKKKSALAKQQEKARKKYNKQIRKNKKNSARKGGSSVASPERKTARTPPPPTQAEPQKEIKAPTPKGPGSGDENPGGLKHKPALQHANLWLARTYVERENYPGVERVLNSLKGNPNLQDDVQKELPIVWAYYALRRKNYAGAIPHLESAIELADKRHEKARLAFILGQIAEMDKSFDVAARYYERTVDLSSDYTLVFNAKLNLARTSFESGAASSQEMVQRLERMLRDEKNTEYKDQIYFALAQIALRQPDLPLAIEHLQNAVAHGPANRPQLTESNYLLAQLYYETGDYVSAKSAYDATLGTMLKNDSRYRQVDRLSKNLTDIARYLNDIALQDSLLRLSLLSPGERVELANALHKKQSSSKQSQDGNTPGALAAGKGTRPGAALAVGGTGGPQAIPTSGQSVGVQSNFFAYNPKEVKRGQREFKNNWGDRPLSDNWRISSISSRYTTFEEAEKTAAPQDVPLTQQEILKILQGIPDTEEQKEAAHEIIQNAMLQLGSLYRDKLEDYNQSIEILESLLQKYPDTKYTLDAYYQLYLSHISINNLSRAEYYKNKIIAEYPSSKYALVLTDPDYLSKQLTEEQRLDRHYQEVYDLVERGRFEEAKAKIDGAKETFGTNHKLQAKYSILEAMCLGNMEGKEAYVEALKKVIGSYPGTPEEIKARDMLLLLGEYQGSRLNLSSAPKFEPDPTGIHFILVMITDHKDADAQDVKVSISNFNRKYYNLDKLKISSLRFDTQGNQTLVLVRSFKDAATAMKYFENAKKNGGEFAPSGTNYEIFPVTQNNYREIVKQKSIEPYRPFFSANYN